MKSKKIAIISIAVLIVLSLSGCKTENNTANTTIPSPTVYITTHGEKYHRSSCRYIKNRDVLSCSEQDAIDDGYKACSVCRP